MLRPLVSFHTAGKLLPHNGSHIIVDQAYVQYIQPTNAASKASARPLLFVHGGGLTGAMWQSTPDRRPGWAILATQAPHHRPVYIIDAVDSGRSQRCPESHRPAAVEYRTAREMWQRFRFGHEEDYSEGDWSRCKFFADSKFPAEHMDRMLASQSARRRGMEQYEAEARGLADAIMEIGECDVVAHSNGCAVTVLALLDETVKAKVGKLVMVEPGPPVTEALEHLRHIRTLVFWGDHLEGHRLWEPTVKHYQQLDGDSTVHELPQIGLSGNSHFPMLDSNSDEVAELVFQFLASE